jgi:hypothetical protein
MDVKTERAIAYCIAVILFVVGVICYAAYPVEVPDEPVRIMFDSTAGSVLFDHRGHLSESGYGLDCVSCHHEDADDPASCSDCHEEDSDVNRVDAFHIQCKGCHEEEEAGPVACSACHVL